MGVWIGARGWRRERWRRVDAMRERLERGNGEGLTNVGIRMIFRERV